jgi:hypothetical protein
MRLLGEKREVEGLFVVLFELFSENIGVVV